LTAFRLLRQYPIIAAFVFVSLAFWLLPQIDMWLMNQVWQEESGFFLAKEFWAVWLYEVFAKVFVPLALLLLLGVGLGFLRESWVAKLPKLAQRLFSPAYTHFLRPYRQQLLFLFLVLVVGSLVVEVLMKGTWGRARPRDILEFGGDLLFTPAWVISGQCSYNCSFVSGHAAIGFYFMSIAWVLKRKVWLLPGLILGLALGLTRIVQGGHFPSDVILPAFVVYFTCHWFSLWLLNFGFHFSTLRPPTA